MSATADERTLHQPQYWSAGDPTSDAESARDSGSRSRYRSTSYTTSRGTAWQRCPQAVCLLILGSGPSTADHNTRLASLVPTASKAQDGVCGKK